MTQYVLNVIEPVMEPGFTPPPEFLEPIMRKLSIVNDELKASGEWVFAGGLNGPDTTTVVRHRRPTERGEPCRIRHDPWKSVHPATVQPWA